MPKKNDVTKNCSSVKVNEILKNIENGHEKNKFAHFLKEFESRVETEICELREATKDRCVSLTSFFTVLHQKIPKPIQKMKFHDYLDMINKDDTRRETRQSFKAELNELCDIPLVQSTKGKSSKKIKATPDAQTFMGPPTTGKVTRKKLCYPSSTKTTLSQSERKTETGPRRSKRFKSSLTALVNTPATMTPDNFRGVFTPKFDPRCPITPAQGLRKPNVGEKVVLMSQDGSPLSHHRKSLVAPAIMFPLHDGKAITISSETEIQNLFMDEDTQERLRFIQKKLASLTNFPIPCLSD